MRARTSRRLLSLAVLLGAMLAWSASPAPAQPTATKEAATKGTTAKPVAVNPSGKSAAKPSTSKTSATKGKAATKTASKSSKSAKSTVAAAGAGFFVGATDPNAPKLKIGVDGSYPPFSVIGKGGKLSGFDIDIASAVCEQIKARCELMPVDYWADVIPSVEAGRYDAVVASMSITDERLKRIDFTKKYYQSPAKLIGRKGLVIATEADLAGKRIGLQTGTTHDDFVKARMPSLDVHRYDTLTQALDELRAGRLDLVMGDGLALYEDFLKSKDGQAYAFVGPDFGDERFFGPGIGIGLPKNQEALKAKLNDAITALRTNGSYQQIAGRYFDFDIYGTD